MKISEAWKISKFPYIELVYRSAKLTSAPGAAAGFGAFTDSQKRFKSILNNAKVSKLVFTLFVCLGSAIPFAGFIMNPAPISLVSGIALSLLIGFAYLVLYCIQILPSFAGADPYSMLLTLPFTESDFSLVTAFSFVRTFDYLAIGSILVPFAMVVVLTRSIVAGILMLGASTINALFAVVIGLWFSGLFYRNITRGGRSKGAVLSRTIFLITWGFAVMSIGFVFNLATYVLPYFDQLITGNLSQGAGFAISLLHPFSFGITITSLVFPKFLASSGIGASATLLAVLSYAAAIIYFIAALIAGRRTGRMISGITHGHGVSIVRETAKEFTLKLRKPFFAFLMRDIRIASKNPSTAFLFALPVFEALIIVLSLSGRNSANIFDIVTMTMIGSLFTLMAGSALLNTERTGLDFTLSLPIDANIIVSAKSLISSLTYTPVPLVVFLLQMAKHGILSPSLLIPFIEILAVSAATTAEIAVFITGRVAAGRHLRSPLSRKGRPAQIEPAGFSMISGANIGRMFKALLIAVVLIVSPVASYIVTISFGYGELVSILAMTLLAILELLIVQTLIRLKG